MKAEWVEVYSMFLRLEDFFKVIIYGSGSILSVADSVRSKQRGKLELFTSETTWNKITTDFSQDNEHCDLSRSLCRVVAHWITK